MVRIKLGPQRPAPQPDPLGRSVIGYVDGLTVGDLWLRGRGVWKANLDILSECDLALIVFDDVVRLVGTVTGVTFHAGRCAIAGRPLPEHPLIGQPDPLANRSRNPIAYGTITTTLAGYGQRSYDEVLTDAIAALTEGARLRREVLTRDVATGKWEATGNVEPSDWAEFVTLAVAGAAANVGSTEQALAGRPGSWEADSVRAMLASTVGPDDEHLLEHRSEPIHVNIAVEQTLSDLGISDLYDESEEILDAEQVAADQAHEQALAQLTWTYRRNEAGDWVPQDAAAPPFDRERWRQDLAADGDSADLATRYEQRIIDRPVEQLDEFEKTIGLVVTRNDKSRAQYVQLQQAHDERPAPLDALQAQRRDEYATYANDFEAQIQAEAARHFSGTPIEVTIDLTDDASDESTEWDSPEARLLDYARQATPLPGSNLAPKDYPPDRSIRDVERAAGRLPHQRLRQT